MTYRRAELCFNLTVCSHRPHGEQGNFIIKMDHPLDNHSSLIDPAAAGRIIPGSIDFIRCIHLGLPLAGRRHDRFDDAGIADTIGGSAHLFQTVGKLVGGCRQTQCFCGQTTDAFTVHSQACGSCGRDYSRYTRLFELFQHHGGDRFDLWYDQIRLFQFDQGAQCLAIGHIDHMSPVRNLMSRCIRITIHRDRFDPQTLQGDDHFFAQLAAAQQHDASGGVT